MPARITSIYAEIESAYAEITPPTFPVGTTIAGDTMLVYGDPAAAFSVEQEFDDISPLTGTKTPQRQVPGITRAKSAIECLLQGSGKPATVGVGAKPYFDSLLRMAGLQYTTSVVTGPPLRQRHSYKFRDSAYESGRIGVYNEEVRQIIAGAQANCRITGDAGKSIRMAFDISGQYREVTSDATPPPVALPVNRALRLMKTALSFAGHVDGNYGPDTTLFARTFELNTGWTLDDRPDFAKTTSENGLAGVEMGVRAPTFSITIEAEKNLVNYDPFKRLIAGDVSETISFTVKSVETPNAADLVTFTIRNPQMRTLTKSVAGDRLLYQLQFNLQNATAQNEFSLDFDTINNP